MEYNFNLTKINEASVKDHANMHEKNKTFQISKYFTGYDRINSYGIPGVDELDIMAPRYVNVDRYKFDYYKYTYAIDHSKIDKNSYINISSTIVDTEDKGGILSGWLIIDGVEMGMAILDDNELQFIKPDVWLSYDDFKFTNISVVLYCKEKLVDNVELSFWIKPDDKPPTDIMHDELKELENNGRMVDIEFVNDNLCNSLFVARGSLMATKEREYIYDYPLGDYPIKPFHTPENLYVDKPAEMIQYQKDYQSDSELEVRNDRRMMGRKIKRKQSF